VATTVQVKKAMAVYAKAHKLEIPAGFNTLSPMWGKPAQTLAWRITGHAGKPQSTAREHVAKILFPPTFGDIVVRIAAAEVGTRESPANSNDGPRVHFYQTSTGAYRQPWCASGAKWVIQQAAKVAKRTVRFPAQAAWVPAWTAMIRAGQNGWTRIEPRGARGGDVVTLWSSQHIEIVVSADEGGLHCIGFNTSPVGQDANGGMVAKTYRTYGEVTVVGRLKG
jgi:hypothetical protein